MVLSGEDTKIMYSVQVQTGRGQPFVVEHLQGVDDVIANVELINEGWAALRDPSVARVDETWDDFFKVVLRCACALEGVATVVLYKSKNLKPLGYMVLLDDSDSSDRHSLFIYWGYSNGKYLGAPEAGLQYVKHWAAQHGYKTVRAQSRRINGAAMRLFRKKLGFKPLAMIFETEV